MVATVLLIAFTIGVGALVSIFATSLTTSSTGIASNQSDALTMASNQSLGLSKCAGAWINVYRVTNNTIFYSNPNGQTITGLVAVYSDGKQSATILDQSLTVGESNSTDISNGTGSASGSTVYTGITPTGATGNTSVTLRGLCQSTVVVEGKCKSGQVCWEA
ncbi:MAG: hypothetical protein HYW23_03145 [Candidatus Aenigmarchaeota archaeon]|nr:hypothetical protein [Candidatus Aenigmarchaeota archaeon]